MKKTKLFITSAILLAMFSVSATRSTKPVKPAAAEKLTECKQCGVTNAQITAYVTRLGYTVTSVVDIPGTCNSTVYLINCQSMVVYVQAGIIVSHSDAGGFCSGSIKTGHNLMTETN